MPTRDPEKYFIQYQFVQMFTEHLCDCSRAFDGDLAEMFVLALIGQAQLKEVNENGLPTDLGSLSSIGVSASRLADITGLHRQSVRRKLQKMEQKGWLFQGSDFRWRLVVKDGQVVAGKVLADLFDRGVERAQRMAAVVNQTL